MLEGFFPSFMAVYAGNVTLLGKIYPKVCYRAVMGGFKNSLIFSAFENFCKDRLNEFMQVLVLRKRCNITITDLQN
jgi:hypothetical protein